MYHDIGNSGTKIITYNMYMLLKVILSPHVELFNIYNTNQNGLLGNERSMFIKSPSPVSRSNGHCMITLNIPIQLH